MKIAETIYTPFLNLHFWPVQTMSCNFWNFSGVRVTRSLVFCVCFVDHCLSFCTFSFEHCVVCSSSIYGFWLPLWYLQTLLIHGTSVHMRGEGGWCLIALSTIFLLYRGGQYHWWRKLECPEKTIDRSQVSDKHQMSNFSDITFQE